MVAIEDRKYYRKTGGRITAFCLFFFCMITAAAQEISDEQRIKEFNRFNTTSFPVMDLETVDSTLFNTSLLANKTVYVDFWFTACPPCIKQIPYARQLHHYFSADTNIVFLNICIENADRRQVWKNMVNNKAIQGINVFYARNRPQKVNLLRYFNIVDYPTYLLLNNLKVLGFKAPAPSEKGLVQWAIYKALQKVPLSTAYTLLVNKSSEANEYLRQNWPAIDAEASP